MRKLEKINVGVLGCAKIAERFVIPAFNELEKLYNLEGIASRSITKARKFAKQFNCKEYENYEKVIKCKNINLVYIPLPNAQHYKWIKDSLINNKHVLVEKSMACSFKEVVELNQLAKEKNLVLFENFQFKYHSQLKLIKKLILKGNIGEIRNVKSSFGFPPFSDKNNIRYSKDLGGGALMDAGAYPLKIAQEILGYDIYVDSASLNYNETLDIDMWGSFQIKSKSSNVTIQAAFGFDNFYQCNLEIWGSKGIIKADRIFTSPPNQSAVVTLINENGVQKLSTVIDNHFKNLLSELYYLVNEKKELETEYLANINQARLIEEVLVKNNA